MLACGYNTFAAETTFYRRSKDIQNERIMVSGGGQVIKQTNKERKIQKGKRGILAYKAHSVVALGFVKVFPRIVDKTLLVAAVSTHVASANSPPGPIDLATAARKHFVVLLFKTRLLSSLIHHYFVRTEIL